MEFAPLIIGFVTIIFVLTYFVKGGGNSKGRSRKSENGNRISNGSLALLSKPPAFHWQDGANFDLEVVGESFYQPQLSALVGSTGGDWVEVPRVATLVPEDDNTHDKNAVAIYIGSMQVGYLSRDDAQSFRRRLAAKKMSGQPTTCDAIIKGGGTVNGKIASFGVWLDMKPFG